MCGGRSARSVEGEKASDARRGTRAARAVGSEGSRGLASESTPPPQQGGGSAKYAILGVALFAIAALVWCMTRPGEDTPEGPVGPAEVDAGVVERSTALVDQELEIPELEPDAGQPDAGQPQEETTTHRPRGTTRSWEECTGDIAVADVRRVVQEYNAQIRNCYERRLKQNPLLEGSMTLAVRVAPDGRVDGTQISGSLRDRDVFSCVRQVSSHMRFPPPGGRDCAVVQVPYSFTPRR